MFLQMSNLDDVVNQHLYYKTIIVSKYSDFVCLDLYSFNYLTNLF